MSQLPTGPGCGGSVEHQHPTETTAVLALVFAFVFSPLGIVFGVIARRNIRQNGHQGLELATAGLWIGTAITAVVALLLAALLAGPLLSLLFLLAVHAATAP